MKIKNLVKVIISSLLSVIGFITVSNSFQTVKAKEQNYSFSIGDFSKKEKTISFESFLENDLSTNDEINKVDVIDLDLSANIGAVNAYMQLAYRYKKAGGFILKLTLE